MGESADWGDQLNAYLIALAGGGGGGQATYVTETFTTGNDIEGSFPRTLVMSAGFVPRAVMVAQVTIGGGGISVSGGWPSWTFSAPNVTVNYLPGLEANTTYTIVWRVET